MTIYGSFVKRPAQKRVNTRKPSKKSAFCKTWHLVDNDSIGLALPYEISPALAFNASVAGVSTTASRLYPCARGARTDWSEAEIHALRVVSLQKKRRSKQSVKKKRTKYNCLLQM